MTVANAANVSGVETLTISGATGTVTQDMDAFTVDTVSLGANGNNTINLNDAAADDVYAFTADNSNGTGTVITLKSDTDSDSTTMSLGASAAGITLDQVTAQNFETLTINSTGGANTITDLTATDLTTLTVNATTALEITGAIGSATALATVEHLALPQRLTSMARTAPLH